MKNLISLFFLTVFAFSCNTHQQPTADPDFNGSFWNDSPEQVMEIVGLGEPNEYNEGFIKQLEWEGEFLGVRTNLDEGIVARMAYFFDNQKLKGAWYYIMAPREGFDSDKYVNELMSEWGQPAKEWGNDEMDKMFYLWKTAKTAIKVMVRDAGDKVRFEWYNYEIEWFEANKEQLLK